ncbi:MAG: hypothetical protein QNJ44_14580 [Rhodobacter sp.]|nr:hypothetical protein [Rhodobacter sp.]
MKWMHAGAIWLMAAFPAAAQFDSAEQVKPILQMIKPQWVSLREFNGQDLLYFTLLEVYRCGLDQIRYVINDGKPSVWETPPCESDETFSEIPADRLPYATFKLGAVDQVRIELTYDDGTVETETYTRAAIMQ